MECYCEPTEGEESSAVWDIRWHVARKEHKCCECSELIKPGERYEYIFSLFDGQVDIYKTCGFCAGEFERLAVKHRGYQFTKGDLACILVWDMREEAAHGLR